MISGIRDIIMIDRRLLTVLGVLLAFLAHSFITTRGVNHRLLIESTNKFTKVDAAYELWKAKFGRLYGSPNENVYRKDIFANNFVLVENTNSENSKYKLELNQMADMTDDEVKARYFGLGTIEEEIHSVSYRRMLQEGNNWATDSDFEHTNYIPFSKDWTENESLIPPTHQRGCGACYAFAAVATLEHLHFKKTGQLLKLSEQELIDCSKGRGNSGCRGGWTHQAYDYVLQFNGLQRSITYPYMGSEQMFCRQTESLNVKDLISGYKRIPENNKEMIKKALHKSVVAAAVDASFLKFYASGVYDNKSCGTIINHAIVIVGYGMEADGTKFWKVRNSWGSMWGYNGYFKILRDDSPSVDGLCGLTKYLVFPTA